MRKLNRKELECYSGYIANKCKGKGRAQIFQSSYPFPTLSWTQKWCLFFCLLVIKSTHIIKHSQERKFHNLRQCLTALVIRKLFTYVTSVPPNNVKLYFLLTGFFTQSCFLAALLISKQPPSSYSYTPGGLGLLGLCLWAFSLFSFAYNSIAHLTPPPDSAKFSRSLMEWETLKNILLYSFYRSIKLTTYYTLEYQENDDTSFHICLHFSLFLSCPHFWNYRIIWLTVFKYHSMSWSTTLYLCKHQMAIVSELVFY